jgi:hypothetical protein
MPAEIKILSDTATQTLQALRNAVAPGRRRGFISVVGRRGESFYRAWFRRRERESPNRRGWPRQHFWARIEGATAYDASRSNENEAVVVVSDQAINAKVYGGTWGAKQAKMLAIPLRPEAYGVRPSAGTIAGIFFRRSSAGNGGYLVRREGKKLVAYWRLVPRVTVAADPQALPPAENAADAIMRMAEAYVARINAQMSGGASA